MRLLSIVAIGTALGLASAAAEPTFYQIQVNRFGSTQGTVSINGVTLSESSESGSFSGVLNTWLQPGENEVLLHLEKGAKADSTDKIELFVAEAKAGQFADEAPRLLTLKWKSGEPLPVDLKGKFKADRAPAVELWNKAEAAPLDDPAKKALTELVKKFHQIVSKRDGKAMVALVSFKIEDVGRAFGMDPKGVFKEASKEMEQSLAGMSKSAKVERFDPKALRFVPMASGKLIKVTGEKGQPPVIVKDTDSETSYEIFAARIGGTWTIVR